MSVTEGITMVAVDIRWMTRHHLREIVPIERSSFQFPWHESEFVACLRTRNCIGMTAISPWRDAATGRVCEEVVGFMVYEHRGSKILLLNFAVASEYRRRGVGTQMIRKLKDKLCPPRRSHLVAMVWESNLPAQLFFRHHGFRATSIIRRPWRKSAEDAYRFAFSLRNV